jgi:hypothetical protein
MSTIIKISIIFITQFFSLSLFSQEVLVGGGGIYNFETEGIGFGARAEYAFDRYSIVPQFNYFPGYNKIHEYYLGVSAHYNLINASTWKLYAIGNLGYNRWIENEDTETNREGNKSNYAMEFGAGAATNGILNPFIEYRYNIKWQDSMLHVGLMYYIGGGSSFICPTYR